MVATATDGPRYDEGRSKKVRLAKRTRLAAAFLLMMISGLVWNSFALFLVALEAEFHWSRASISGAYGAFALTNAVTAPLFGYMLGRWNSRVLLASVAVLLGVAFLLMAKVTTIEQYWLTFGLIGGIGAHCTSSYAIFAVLAGRFRHRPATAMAVADAGSGLAAFLGLPIINWMIIDSGWRFTYSALGIIMIIIAVPLHLLVLDRIKTTVKSSGTLRAGGLSGFILFALTISYFCGSAAYHGLLTQQIALFDERNINENTAVWIAAVAGLVIFLWRLLSGWLCDIWGPGRVMAIAGLAGIITFGALAIVLAAGNPTVLFIYPLVLGVAFGGQQVLLANGARLIVPLSALAGILGICRFAAGAGMASGPVIAGYLHDWTGGYAASVIVIGVLALLHFLSFAIISFRSRPD
jgi:MFS family permease